jgi:hypothetical protein
MSISESNRKVAALAAIAAALIVTTILVIVFSGDGEPLDTSGAPSAGKSQPAARSPETGPDRTPQVSSDEPDRILCTVRANGGGLVRLPKSTPMYIECIFANPMKDKAMKSPQIESVTPVLTNRDGAKISVKLSPAGANQTTAPPWGVAVLAWEIDAELAPGTYTVTVRLPKSFPGSDGAGRSVRIRPARLIVTDKPDDNQLSARARRRLALLKGKGPEVVSELSAALAANPTNRFATLELVSVLAGQGKHSQSRDVLLDYLAALQGANPGGNDDKTAEIPCWAAAELEFLNAKCRKPAARTAR